MRIPHLFVLFLIFLFIFQHHLRKHDKNASKSRDSFWEHEKNSMFIRKKNIEEHEFIKTNINNLPQYSYSEFVSFGNEDLYSLQEKCINYAKEPMMNLQGLLNSELRYKYGTANVDAIEGYENNYTQYIKCLFKLGKGYYELNKTSDAISVLEEGIQIGTDISDHYVILGKLYSQVNDLAKFEILFAKANSLTSLTKNKIIKELTDIKTNFD